uniref:Uncharacterized protein n=1 Tax=Ceratitis capitata TaxID=7213 RepID=W8B8B6_CERCA
MESLGELQTFLSKFLSFSKSLHLSPPPSKYFGNLLGISSVSLLCANVALVVGLPVVVIAHAVVLTVGAAVVRHQGNNPPPVACVGRTKFAGLAVVVRRFSLLY